VADAADDELPAWSTESELLARVTLPRALPDGVDRAWAFGGANGAGIRVAVVDSGIDAAHPLVGAVASAVVVSAGADGEEPSVTVDTAGDLCGHGTACAGVIRALAPACELHSVRVLGAGFTGSGPVLLAGIRWAIEQGFDVINLSLSTTKPRFEAMLRELADRAWFDRSVVVASAHNMPVESFPWRFASVISVGSHDVPDAWTWYANPEPPVDLFARGYDVEVAWLEGATIRATGNSFATPHVAGLVALLRSKHPNLTPAMVKAVLETTASNSGSAA
jgi:subtilisin family serine protease